MSRVSVAELPEREVMPGLRARFVHSERSTLGFWRIEKGAALPEHHHPHEQVAHLVSGRFTLVVNGRHHEMQPGDVVVIPPNIPHSGKALTDCEIMDVFTPVRRDYQL